MKFYTNARYAPAPVNVRVMRAFLAAAAMAVLCASTAHADSDDDAFIQAISGDGISMDRHEAVVQGHAACLTMESGTSMWETIQQVKDMHPSFGITGSTHFVDRSIQNYCPQFTP